jgi:hypothetical protein
MARSPRRGAAGWTAGWALARELAHERSSRPEPAAGVLISGAFGTGKSSTAEEMATILEARGLAYAAMDLDRLTWFHTGRAKKEEGERVMLDNLVAVVQNYLRVGVQYFVLAGWFGEQTELDALRAALPFPLTVVELRASWPTIERRMRSRPTSGRLDDLRRARNQIEVGEGAPRVDAAIDGDRPVGEVASDILRLLRW